MKSIEELKRMIRNQSEYELLSFYIENLETDLAKQACPNCDCNFCEVGRKLFANLKLEVQ